MHPAIPTFYLRYEDLVIDPLPALTDLFCFLLEVSSIKGTVIEKRIADYLEDGSKKAVYKLKADPKKGILRNKPMFTEAQLEMMKEKCRNFLYYFNYTDNPDGEADPNTTYFVYDGETQHDKAKLDELHNGYLKSNAQAIQNVAAGVRTGASTFAFNDSFPVDNGM